jgi:predicted RNase H-like nuclease
LIAGVDGCRAGWFVVLSEVGRGTGREEQGICTSFREVLDLEPKSSVIAIDIPIGLLEEPSAGRRECDKEALTAAWHSEAQQRLHASDPGSSRVRNLRRSAGFGAGVNRQAFGLLPKIWEVNQLMTPEVQKTVGEMHPELCFYGLSGYPMRHKKKSTEGKAERLGALQGNFSGIGRVLGAFPRSQVASDDILDAYAAAWTAIRIAENAAKRIPLGPPIDVKGLRMEMWY